MFCIELCKAKRGTLSLSKVGDKQGEKYWKNGSKIEYTKKVGIRGLFLSKEKEKKPYCL